MDNRTDHSRDSYREGLQERRQEGLYRSLHPSTPMGDKGRISLDGREMTNLCSNDYLGLSSHPYLRERAIEMLERYGTGSASSRLVSGSLQCHHDLEEALAEWSGREAALLFVSGFQANTTILPSLTGREDWILADKQVHRSLLEGARLSRATFRRFRHNDLSHLESLLTTWQETRTGNCWIVAESIYSMDGDRAPLNELVPLARRYGARLMIDDAHAVGLYGKHGRGLAADYPEVDLIVGTSGKALGSSGAFALLSHELREWLVNYCPGIIYSTGPSPAATGATMGAVEMMSSLESRRASVLEQTKQLYRRLTSLGIDPGPTDSTILPVRLPDNETALSWSRRAAEHGFHIQAIRPPTVQIPRLRLTVCHGVSSGEWDRFTELLEGFHAD